MLSPPEPWAPEVWVEVDEGIEPAAPARPSRKAAASGAPLRREAPRAVGQAGGPRGAPKVERRLADAARAYDAGRYQDALRMVRPLVELAPPEAVRELYGLVLYRLGRWKAAIKELQAAHEASGSFDQYPVIADCLRALGRHAAVERVWEDLRHASPSGEVIAEGRIVMAGSFADRGRFADAIALLEKSGVDRARPREHHLRTWYVLADLYERAGDLPRARELFRRLATRDPDFFDVAIRLAAL